MRRRSRRRPAAATANRDDDDGDDAAAPFVVRADGCCDTPFVVLGVPSTPTTGGGEQLTVQDPDSGFAFSLRSWYDWTKGLSNISASWIIGQSVGNPNAALRVVDACHDP